jgi:hypothetical protein
MGRAKQAWFEAQERGWDELDKLVCAGCVDDVYLAILIKASAHHKGCDYCADTDVPTAEVSCILDAVNTGIHYAFNDEANAGAPYSKDFSIEYLSTQDVLEETLSSEGVNWCDELIEDVAGALHDVGWVEAPEGEFLGSYEHQRYRWSWAAFVSVVKHQSRFHFHIDKSVDDYGERPISPAEMLGFLGHVFEHNQMVQTISADAVFLRVRKGVWPLLADEAGPPPHTKATGGRMNPAGIPYLYLAFDERTALAEARAVVAEDVTISQWQPSRELRMLDLTHQPQCMSIFEGHDPAQDHVVFLRHFVDDIRKPVGKDDLPEIEYVPTQLVCEYLAQVFSIDGKPLDGLIYISALTPGKNLVLFPERTQWHTESSLKRFGTVKFQSAKVIKA